MGTLTGALPRQVQDTLAEIEERGEAVRELEKSLLDLHQIFLDMAVLVEAQGEMLDNIEAQVRPAVATRAGRALRRRLAWRIFMTPSWTAAYSCPAQMPCSMPRTLFRLRVGLQRHVQHFISSLGTVPISMTVLFGCFDRWPRPATMCSKG